MSAEGCVNRQQELRQLEDALQLLRQDPRQDPAAQRLPVITLCGLVGIGKTTLLRQVEQRAQALGLPVLWRNLPTPEPAGAGAGAAILAQLQPALETCLHEQGRAVLLLDDVDPANPSQLQQLSALLQTPGGQAPLLVIVTAGRPLSWSWERVLLPQPLQVLELGPLDPASSALLLERHAPALSPEARALALTWADGYPLALVVLADALRDGTLDPRQPAARARLLEQLTGRVLRQGVLGALPPEERPVAETLLRLLAVPRRFTAMLLQDLIEQFAPALTQEHPFAYFFLPQRLSARTSTLRWQFGHAGYVVVEPVRHLLQVLWREQDPDRWQDIQRWLAAFWSQRARQGRESERVGALLEWSLQRLQLAAPAARAQESQALLAELAAWPWRDPGERQQALALLGQDQELLTTLGEQAAAWQAALRALALQPPPS
ncbi:hypothetical protein [Thermogemmatispora onikobensis]|uniref:hypothetical protein n=1 Tax=Thermogemmatispora onikobensis TaxID=732234 RepID=UPI00085396D4|nr:hypothetical protein [Thermogemmatispora onikobensis]